MIDSKSPQSATSPSRRTDASLGGDSLLLSVGRMAGLVSTMVLFILLSRTLTPQTYGSFRQVWMINKGLVEIFALGLPLSILYYLARLPDSEKRRFIAQSVLLLSTGAAITALAIFLFSGRIAAAFGNPDLAHLLRLFACYPVLIAPTLAVESVLVAGGRASHFAVFTLLSRTAVLAAGGLAIALGGNLTTLFSLILGAGAIEISGALLLLRSAARRFEERDRPGQLEAGPSVREQLALALPTGLSNMVGLINQELDKFLIASSFTVGQFARYANGAMEIPMLGTIVGSVSTVLMPEYTSRFHAGDRREVLRLWHEAVCKFALLQFPLLIFFGFYATDTMVLLFSDTYRESAPIFQVYIIATIPKLTWYGTVLVAIGRTRAPLYGSLVALTVNILLNILLIRLIGFVGPAIATAVASYGVTTFYLARIRSALDVRWSEVFPWLRLARILIVGLSGAVVFILFEQITSLPVWTHLVLSGGVYAMALLGAYGLLGYVSWTDIKSVVSSLRAGHDS